MKLRLESVYTQSYDGSWDAEIVDCPHIHVFKAEDLETARVFLKIITAEEVDYINKFWNRRKDGVARRKDWEITKETINYFKYSSNYGEGVEHD